MLEQSAINGFIGFALKLIQNTAQAGKNVLVSPYSVMQALRIAAAGAKGETRSEILSAMNLHDESECCVYSLTPDTENVKLLVANSAWIRQNYPLRDDYIHTITVNNLCDIFQVPFDSSTVKQINHWIGEKTDHMIPSIVSRFSDQTALCLINAVCFEADWIRPYREVDLQVYRFTAADGENQLITMMMQHDDSYLKDEHAEGFIAYYRCKAYAFAAFLPEEGMTPEEYLASLTPERLFRTLSEPVRSKNEVITGLPKFKYEFDSPLNDALMNAGMQKAFQIKEADFSGMTDDPAGLYLSKVLHKTFIEVTPFGTRAGAGTFVDWAAGCIPDPEPKRIILSRPFVYLIFDMQTKLPLFIGTVNSIPNDPEEKE